MKVSSLHLPILAFCLFVSEIEAKDYYKVLGINKKATEKEVKKAFREKAKLLHPDKNDSPDAEQQFRELAEAYEVLSDPQKRKSYDRGGVHGHHGTKATNFDFSFDDLFRQFEQDIFADMQGPLKGHFASHFASHFGHHHQATGGAFNLDDLFKEDDFFANDFMNFGEVRKPASSNAKQHCKTVTKNQ